jgi:hypothetical protein
LGGWRRLTNFYHQGHEVAQRIAYRGGATALIFLSFLFFVFCFSFLVSRSVSMTYLQAIENNREVIGKGDVGATHVLCFHCGNL